MFIGRKMRGITPWILLAATICSARSPTQSSLSQLHQTKNLSSADPLPLLLWHGLGDSFDRDGISAVAELAEHINPGTFVYPIRLAEDGSGDRSASFFGNVTAQLSQVCEDIASHAILSQAPAVNALGFSQGGQFLRAYIERCNDPPVRNLVTFGSQHNGITEYQECDSGDWLCKGAEGLLRSSTWSSFVQSNLVPAQYFRDPEDLENYLENSNFLADVNNERQRKNPTYKKNLASIDKLVMYMFEDDSRVHPKESAWFAEVNSTSGAITPLRNRTIYKEDWLGLKLLDEKGGLVFKTTPGEHMQLDEKVLGSAFKKYFSPKVKSAATVSDDTHGESKTQLLLQDWADL